jgi:glycosyltransferase involved in cell wall biosynthesis
VLVRELATADVVYVRCPSNIGLLTLILLVFVRSPAVRLVKYAGDWTPSDRDPWSYRFQRFWLRYARHRAQVTVNSSADEASKHIHRFLNPSLTRQEWRNAGRRTERKSLTSPLRLLFVGRLDARKGALRAARCCLALHERGWDARLDVVGEGPEAELLDDFVRPAGAERMIVRRGWLGTSELSNLYQGAHFFVLPSESEGWPKVVSEAMAFRAVPVVGAVSCIPEVLAQTGAGLCLPYDRPEAFVAAIEQLALDESKWRLLADNGQAAGERFTYERHVQRIGELLNLPVADQISDTAAA